MLSIYRTVGGGVLATSWTTQGLFEIGVGKFKKEWIQWKSCGSGMTEEIGFENHLGMCRALYRTPSARGVYRVAVASVGGLLASSSGGGLPAF